MKKRLYIKNRKFLKSFIIVLFFFMLLAILIVGSVYRTSLGTLQQEVEGMSESKTQEVANRIDEVLKTCNEMAITLSLDDTIQMFFVCQNPQYYVESYYDNVGAALKVQGISYIDSIILYAPEYRRMYDSSTGKYTILTENMIVGNTSDTSWMDTYRESSKGESVVFTRAKAGRWPYYLTVMHYLQSKTADGVILVNIDLNKLYDYLLMDDDSSVQLYLLDDNNRIFLKEDKQELYTSVESVEGLEDFESGKTYSKIKTVDKNAYTYTQNYMKKYGFTCASITPVGDYFTRLTQLQTGLIWMICFAAFVAVLVACIYSVSLEKPQRENLLLKEELNQNMDMLKSTKLVALQLQINPHFMFNTMNIASLMIENDCGDGHPAAQLLGDLSDILRYSLSEKNNVCIREEIACVKKYLTIMKRRYGDFDVVIHVEEQVYDYIIPKLILQPLVENALQHGISLCLDSRQGCIEIRAQEVLHTYKNGKELPSVCLDIIDNGLGIDTEKLEKLRNMIAEHNMISGEHIGLSNVVQRFYLLFHDEQEVTIDSAFGDGTDIRLVFPVKNQF